MSEKSQEEIKKETEEFMQKHRPVGIPVTKEQAEKIKTILGEKKMSENNDVEKLKAELEEERSKREDFEAKLKIIGEQKLNEKIEKLHIPEADQQYFRENPEALKGYELGKSGNSGKGGAGTLPANLNHIDNSGNPEDIQREFSSNEEMLAWTKQNSPETYQKIFDKVARGLPKTNMDFEDTFTPDGETMLNGQKIQLQRSMIGRIIDRENERIREKALKSRKVD
jgi:hypothetical protein